MSTIEKITSRENRRLKEARKVRDGRLGDLIFIEGLRLAEEALRSGVQVFECFTTKTFSESPRGEMIVRSIRSPIFELSENLFESIADTNNSQGIVLICPRPTAKDLELHPARMPIIVCLDQVNNPSNLGAVCRTAEAAGASGLVVTAGSADAFSAKAIRAAMGSAFRFPIRQGESLDEIVQLARDKQLRLTVTAATGSTTYTELDWKVPRLLIFGSEGHGLTAEQSAKADDVIAIPMQEGVESLNLAVACGVVLFEARRHHPLCR